MHGRHGGLVGGVDGAKAEGGTKAEGHGGGVARHGGFADVWSYAWGDCQIRQKSIDSYMESNIFELRRISDVNFVIF